MKSFIIGKNESGQRFDKYLKKLLPACPPGLLFKSLRKKNITLNRKKAEGHELLKEGDTAELFFSDETFERFKSSVNTSSYLSYKGPKPEIVFENEDVLIANKPAGLLSQSDESGLPDINTWLISYLLSSGKLSEKELETFKPSACNRLDRNTSGLIICGKSLKGSQEMTRLIREGLISKYYLTLVHGSFKGPAKASGILVKDKNTNKVSVSSAAEKDANIFTEFKLLKETGGCSLLEVRLHTGKPHQIRAQLAALGYPVYGDRKYGLPNMKASEKKLGHQLLQAYRLEFSEACNLDDLKRLTIKIEPSKEIKDALCRLGTAEA